MQAPISKTSAEASYPDKTSTAGVKEDDLMPSILQRLLSRPVSSRRRRLQLSWLRRAFFFLFVTRFLLDVAAFCSHRVSPSRSLVAPRHSSLSVFIASTQWNNEPILRRSWNKAVVDLVQHFRPNATFVSIYESGSWDGSKTALNELKTQLDAVHVRNKIVLDPSTHEDETAKPPTGDGWVDTPRGRKELRRIPYLSRLRNLSLQPLYTLARDGITFDVILFLNDVVFTSDDVFTLLHTRRGDYAAACALDFLKAPNFEDTFALRDLEGHAALMSRWPYFRSSSSRSALQRHEPVPVSSCWNGMVFMKAAPFYDEERPLRFRGIPDSLALSHLEASECCLIHQDNPFTQEYGVYVNPHVRVGYTEEAYDAMHGLEQDFPLSTYLTRVWESRARRWLTTDWLKSRVVNSRLNRWRKLDPSRNEVGVECIVNEMQVLADNGWMHM